MKHFHKIPLLLSGGIFLCLLFAAPLTSRQRFHKLCDTVFREELSTNTITRHYTAAEPERYGIDCTQATLGTAQTPFTAKLRLLKNFLCLQTIARGSLNEEEQMTYDLLQYTFDVSLDGLRFETLREPLAPSIGIQSQLPVLLAEYAFHTEKDVKDYLQLLGCVPEYFDSILALEQKKLAAGTFMDEETAAELADCCRQFPDGGKDHFLSETFRERLTALNLPPEKIAGYIEENNRLITTTVFPAYEKLAQFLDEHTDDGTEAQGLAAYPDGTDYYRLLLRSEVGTERSFEEIERQLEEALDKEAHTIAALLKANPQLDEARRHIVLDTSDPAALTARLSEHTARDFPAVKEANVSIRSVPRSMEAHLSPAFYLVPPVDAWQDNVVYLNQGSLTDGLSFFTTLAHETYPGHLYQTVYENSRSPHPVRRLLYFGGYTEGWATYAEQLSYFYAPISKELAALLSSLRAMTLNIYSHLDLYIHAYGWTEEECRAYLKEFGITNRASVHDMFLLVKQQPANYLKYYLGYIEICSLKEKAQAQLGADFNLKEFHRFLLDCGPAPFCLLEKKTEEWLHSSVSSHFISSMPLSYAMSIATCSSIARIGRSYGHFCSQAPHLTQSFAVTGIAA